MTAAALPSNSRVLSPPIYLHCRDRADRDEDAAMITAYVTMGQEIESMGLEGVWNMKPMFNGGEVKTILPKIPRGPAFSDVMNVRGVAMSGSGVKSLLWVILN